MVDSADTATASPGVNDDTPHRKPGLRAALNRPLDWLALWLRRHRTTILVSLLFIVIGLIALAPQIFITVPSGHVGVLWYRFFGGTVTDRTYGEGIHMIFPWDEMYLYDARLQNQSRVYDTISSNGLSMKVDIAVRYRINRDNAGILHKLVGPRYPEVLVYPEIGSHARELISRYTPEQLYTETRAFIQAEILERMVNQLGSSLVNQSFRGKLVSVEDVLIRSVTLPPRIAAAIERKAEQYQVMLEYDFRLAREEKEKQRKKIEAEGIREFQDIVAKTITPEYLRLRGIEATMALATSKNSKTIIIGGRDGLPVILNTADSNINSDRPADERAEKGDKSAELSGDTANTLPSGQQLNARMADVAPQSAISPGFTETEGPAGAVDGMPNGAASRSQKGTISPNGTSAAEVMGPDGERQTGTSDAGKNTGN
ncbi:prohibitin family protein [Thalassospira mesophila]|uniref:prohibitin family protein n=1 Tax=Thalassospira mesophila TaxID=1293891 RepID=UPI000A1E3446|nr:prohibitin family protein [Thalassospira mesophila]